MAVLGLITFIGMLSFFGSIWRGFVLTKLWLWFAVPIFNLPVLAIAPAIGLSLLIGFLTYQYHYKDEEGSDNKKQMVHATSVMIFHPLFALLIGWIIHCFM